METVVLGTKPADINQAAQILHQHQPVAFPTETVYGLGAKVFDELAIRRIYELKGRPADNPLIAHVANISQVELLAESLPDDFFKLAEAFWPGPLTMVLSRKVHVPALISANLPTVAIRMPDHPVALQLIKAAGEPLVAPSANLSGKPSPTTSQHVLEDLDGQVAAVIDGGPTTYGIESTVIDLTQSPPVILRPGSITAEQLEKVINQPIEVAPLSATENVASPGMKYRHYAPTARVKVFETLSEFLATKSKTQNESEVVLTNLTIPSDQATDTHIKPLTSKTLFAEFRAADTQGIESISIILDPETKADAGLLNRIIKAAAVTTD